MNITRHELLNAEAIMNQMRNNIYELARFMKKNGVKDSEKRLRRMGRNMARTIFNYWKPIDIVDASNIKDVISTFYQKIVNSNVIIDVDEGQKLVSIKDYKCSLCKYQYEDINISAIITNTGEAEGIYDAELKINGVVEATKSIPVFGGETETIVFSISKDVAGDYTVEIDGKSATLKVAGMTRWVLIAWIIGGAFVLGLLIFLSRKYIFVRG